MDGCRRNIARVHKMTLMNLLLFRFVKKITVRGVLHSFWCKKIKGRLTLGPSTEKLKSEFTRGSVRQIFEVLNCYIHASGKGCKVMILETLFLNALRNLFVFPDSLLDLSTWIISSDLHYFHIVKFQKQDKCVDTIKQCILFIPWKPLIQPASPTTAS